MLDPLEIYYRSNLPQNLRGTLEDVLFFTPEQKRHEAKIAAIVEQYGSPRIVDDGSVLRVNLGTSGDCQALFAMHPMNGSETLLGVLVYQRLGLEELIVLHVAVNIAAVEAAGTTTELLFLGMIDKLKQAARRIKGLDAIRLAYSGCRMRLFHPSTTDFSAVTITQT